MAAEQLRRLLLKEMGITSWLPRTPLPGAALSHEQCLQNFLDDAPASPVSQGVMPGAAEPRDANTRPAVEPGPSVARLAELLGGTPPASVVHKAAAPDTAGAAPVNIVTAVTGSDQSAGSQSEDVGAFGFSWFNVDTRLAVLAELPAGNTRLTSSCRQMLARMLAALHTPWQSLTLVDQNFHWPFADDLGLPADANAARQAVDGFIARRLREQNCAMLLVLCDGLPWFFRQADAGGHDLDSQGQTGSPLHVHRQFGFAMLATHSLHAMEKDAGLKRDAWQSMQVLRERLNRNN